jgi:CheY-like chemotaxis protein
MIFSFAHMIWGELRARLCMMCLTVTFQFAPASVEECGGGGPVAASQPRVLIVDDHVDTADVMQMFLARAGYDVRAVYSGADALAIADEFTPDLAILDILLPDMSGYEVALRLRAGSCGDDASGCRLRLLALSSCSAPDHDLAECFDEVARKPIDGAELRRLLRRLTPR